MVASCSRCEKPAVVSKPSLCKGHFDEFILDTVQSTIETYELFSKKDNICVAVSGGKDSLALVDILTRLGYNVEGLLIDEGIGGYREFSINDMDEFSKKNNIKYRIISFKEIAGFTLDEAMNTKKVHACTACGTLRRYLLNKYAKEYDIIATGHNLDDESQTILINLARGNTDLLLRLGPKTQSNKHFVRRVKPLYFVSEKHVLAYTLLRNIKTKYVECPYAGESYRASVRDELNKWEEKNPGAKKNIVKTYLQLKKTVVARSKEMNVCVRCGEASLDNVCRTCKTVEKITSLVQQNLQG